MNDPPKVAGRLSSVIVVAAMVGISLVANRLTATQPATAAIAVQPVRTSLAEKAKANCMSEFVTQLATNDLFNNRHPAANSHYTFDSLAETGTFKFTVTDTATTYFYCQATDKDVLLTGMNQTWPVLYTHKPEVGTPQERAWRGLSTWANTQYVAIVDYAHDLESQKPQPPMDNYCWPGIPSDYPNDPEILGRLAAKARFCYQRALSLREQPAKNPLAQTADMSAMNQLITNLITVNMWLDPASQHERIFHK